MSMYGDDSNGYEKEHLHTEIANFLENHSTSELFEIIAMVFEYRGE